jgi:hypothetical protein
MEDARFACPARDLAGVRARRVMAGPLKVVEILLHWHGRNRRERSRQKPRMCSEMGAKSR